MSKKLTTFEVYSLLGIALIFLVAMNISVMNVGGIGLALPFNSTTWFVTGTLLLVMTAYIVIKKGFSWTTNTIGIGLSLVVIMLPLLWNDTTYLERELNVIFAVFVAFFFLIFSVQSRTAHFKKSVLSILLLCGLIQMLWGILQFYVITESNFISLNPAINFPHGVFQQVNVYSIFIASSVLIAIRKFGTNPSKTRFAMAACTTAIGFHLIMLTESNTGAYISLISLVTYCLITSRKLSTKTRLGLLSLVTIGILCFTVPKSFFAPIAIPDRVQYKVDSNKSDEDVLAVNFGTRPIIYSLTTDLIVNNPFSGVGIGQFSREFAELRGQYLIDNPDRAIDELVEHPHNEILYWVSQLGLFSLLGFIGIFVVIIRGMIRGTVDTGIILLAMPIVGQAMLEMPLYGYGAVLLMLVLLVGISDKSETRKVEIKPEIAVFSLYIASTGHWISSQMFYDSFKAAHLMSKYVLSGQTDTDAILGIQSIPPSFDVKLHYLQQKIRLDTEQESLGVVQTDKLEAFVFWNAENIQHSPLQPMYVNLIESLIMLGNKEMALQFAREAILIHPRSAQINQLYQDLLNASQ